MKKTLRLIALIATLAMILVFAACAFFNQKGSLKLESFIIDRSSIKTSYSVGEAVDLSGIKAVAKYSDETLNKTYTFGELTISDTKDITATAGTKEITVSFQDPHLGVEQKATVLITVTDGVNIEPEDELFVAVQFEKPEALNSFDGANNVNTALGPEDSGFAGQFATGGKTYIIGNENAFRFTPAFSVLGEDDVIKALENFHSVVEIAIEKNGVYVTLTAKAGEGTQVSYYDGETRIATVDTYKGIYNFSTDAEGLKVKISVLPSKAHYIFETFNPVVLEAKIIRAYNVYEAWELAVIDNYNAAWTEFKIAHGIANVTVSGIVLHNDIKVSAEDVPESFFFVSEKDVVYKNSVTGETVTIPKGTKFLKDEIFIYERFGLDDFAIEGNLFTIDTGAFPLIASSEVFGVDAGKDYGDDFSNVALFRFSSVDWKTVTKDTIPTKVSNVTIKNLSLIGNAARNNMVTATTGQLVSAGGLIFCKASNYTNVFMDNIIGNSYFITYFVDYGANMTVTNAKCYNSYQNAAFVWSNCKFNMTDSYVDGCGGPAIMAQSVLKYDWWNPSVTVTGGNLQTSLVGDEVWFKAVHADNIIDDIKALSKALEMAQLGHFVKDNKLNIMAALMADGDNADQIIKGIQAQGKIFVDGEGIDRNITDENRHWTTIKNISEYAMSQPGGMLPPFFTVYDESNNPHTIYYTGLTEAPFVDLAGNALGSNQAIIEAFMQAETITLTQGGLSVVFEFYHD